MSVFTRRWGWRNEDGLPTTRRIDAGSEPDPLLDVYEQEALVQSFEQTNKWHNFIWRGIFAAFAAVFAAFFTYSAYQQAVLPWSIKYHADLVKAVESHQIIIAELAEALTCIGITVGVFSPAKWHRRLLWTSTAAGVVLSFFWLHHLFRSPAFQWRILWLPLGTSSLAAICLYVDSVLSETAKDIQTLRASMYHYKNPKGQYKAVLQ